MKVARRTLSRFKNFWRMMLILGTVFIAGGVMAARGRGPVKNSQPVSAHRTSRALPAAATSVISASLGRDQQAYHAAVVHNGFIVKNPRFNLQATFTRQGVRLESGKASWGMALAAFGTSGKLQPVAAARPQANANRVEYRRGALTEWYVNGPAGLEQGFTIAKAPAGSANGTIELALRLTGNLTASLDAAKTGLILKGRQTSLRYSGLTARDAKGRKLRSWLEVRNGRLLVQVAAAGASYPLVVDPYIYIQSAKLVASDGHVNDYLGLSVAISGDGSTVVAENFHGDAYVFTFTAPSWAQAAKLTPSDPSYGAGFLLVSAQEVAVSNDGKVVVVGSPGLPYSGGAPGAAFVFVEPPDGWKSATSPLSETARLYASDGAETSVNNQDFGVGDDLGFSVAVSADGKTVVAGAPAAVTGLDPNTYPIQGGAAYVFKEPEGGWGSDTNQEQTEAAKLVASNGGDYGGSLGWSVSIGGTSADGSVAVVAGAPGLFGITSWPQGSAYVFDEPENGWEGTQNQTAKLTASDGTKLDLFGYSVVISGDGSTVVAGAPGAPDTIVTTPTSSSTDFGPGAAYVFVKPSSGWTGTVTSPQHETAELLASDGVPFDFFGVSVAVSEDGSTVAAGSPRDFSSQGTTGVVYSFAKPLSGWGYTTPQKETDKVLASDMAPGNNLGFSTSMSTDGLKLATGAAGDLLGQNTGQGAAYVFTGYVQFSAFDASKLSITLGPPSSFALNSSFTLDQSSIDFSTEPVTLEIGSLSLTIPAGSFQLKQKKKGDYDVFSGVVNGFTINAKFEYQGFYTWSFKVNGSSPNALSITNPVTVNLIIGNDAGTATETVPIN